MGNDRYVKNYPLPQSSCSGRPVPTISYPRTAYAIYSLPVTMVSRQIHRHISAVTPVARRRKFGVHTVHSNAPPTAAVLATQPFAPKPGRTQTRTLPATACSSLQQQGLSTSAGAATSGTGEDNTGGNSSKGSGDGSGRATRHEVGGAAVLSERKRRG
ncbi:unnamed protein product, partial [Pylaiella littoralis]